MTDSIGPAICARCGERVPANPTGGRRQRACDACLTWPELRQRIRNAALNRRKRARYRALRRAA